MVLETLDFSSLNHLTQLVAREGFITQCRRESYKSYKINADSMFEGFSRGFIYVP
jgi:hypothetical protein